MKRKAILLLVLILTMLICAGVFLFRDSLINDDSYRFSYHENIEVKAGKAEPAATSTTFTVREDGTHHVSLSWLPMGKTIEEAMQLSPEGMPFITGCVISSDEDPCAYATTGGWLTTDTSMELKAGEYTIHYYYLTSKEAYIEFANQYFGSVSAQTFAEVPDWDHMKKDDKLVVSYNTSVSPEGNSVKSRAILLVVTILLCILLMILAFTIATGGKLDRFRYDERQEALRGKGFRIAFYTMIGYMLWIYIVDTMGFISEGYYTILYMGGMVLGISIYAVYAIWHECYFAINESRKNSIWIMAVIGLANLLIGINGLINMLKTGGIQAYGLRVTSRTFVINLGLAFVFILLAVTMLLKRASICRSGEEEEEA